MIQRSVLLLLETLVEYKVGFETAALRGDACVDSPLYNLGELLLW